MDTHYNWKGQAFANLVIAIVLLALVVNAGLVVGFQRMTSYTYGSQDEVLAEYGAYTLLDSEAYSTQSGVKNALYSWLIQTKTMDIRLVSMEKHFLFDRYRLVSDEAVNFAEFETVLHADSEARTVSVLNQREILPGSKVSKMFGIMAGLYVPTKVCLWIFGLFVIEIIAAILFFKIRKNG